MKYRGVIFVGLLALTLSSLYWRTFNYELIWDDDLYFKDNVLLTENRPLQDAFKLGYFSEQIGIMGSDHYYRPLLTLSFMIEDRLWGIHNGSLRAVNLLIFLLSLACLYKFFRQHQDQGFFAEIATLLFAFYPLNLDNIVWIVGRGDLILLLCGSLAFLCFDLFIKRGTFLFAGAASAAYLMGIFSKESFIFFWPVLLIYDFVRNKRIHLPFHAINLICTLSFFLIKGVVLRISNPKIVLGSNLIEILRTFLGTLGFYFKTMLFPFSPKFFLSTQDAQSGLYLFFGIIAVVCFLGIALLAIKDKSLLPPLSLIVVFLFGHAFLVFSSVMPYTIYSRYLMIPGLGLAWFLAILLCRLKERVRLFPFFVLIVLFIPTIVINAAPYKSNLDFWRGRPAKQSAKDGYILFHVAKAYYAKKDILRAELNLNRCLSMSMEQDTAILVSMLYTELEFAKADYIGVEKWQKSLENLQNLAGKTFAPIIKGQINDIKAKVLIARGEVAEAEKLLEENILRAPDMKETYVTLYKMFIGHEKWDKARELETRITSRFPSFPLRSSQIAEELKSMSPAKRISFYILNNNYIEAKRIVEIVSPLDLPHKVLFAKLAYWSGNESEGKNTIERIAAKNPGNTGVMNSIAAFYLKDLYRAKEALLYLNKSYGINPQQPQIHRLINSLNSNYLNLLKPVWK